MSNDLSLVEQLQVAAADPSTSVSDLLRKARLVAAKLGLDEIDQLLTRELNGYPSDIEPPAYRSLRGQLKARGWGNVMKPLVSPDGHLEKALQDVPFRESVAEIEAMLPAKGSLLSPIGFIEEVDAYAYVEVGRHSVVGLLNVVRNSILDWSLELGKRGISGDSFSFTADEKEAAMESPTITNFHFHNVEQANVQHRTVASQQTATLVTSNRLDELAALLHDALSSLELSEDDRAEIKRSIETIEAEAKKPDAERETGPLRTTLGRVTNILVGADAARELIQSFVNALASL